MYNKHSVKWFIRSVTFFFSLSLIIILGHIVLLCVYSLFLCGYRCANIKFKILVPIMKSKYRKKCIPNVHHALSVVAVHLGSTGTGGHVGGIIPNQSGERGGPVVGLQNVRQHVLNLHLPDKIAEEEIFEVLFRI